MNNREKIQPENIQHDALADLAPNSEVIGGATTGTRNVTNSNTYTGVLTLSNANTYAGTTFVNASSNAYRG